MHKKDDRQKCYDARDTYFSCIVEHFGDKIGPPIPDAIAQPPSVNESVYNTNMSQCAKELQSYERSCPKSWYVHFIKKFHLDVRNKQLGLK